MFNASAQQLVKVVAQPIDDVISIDGLLDEPVWRNADSATGFKQVEPIFNGNVSHQTSVKILYSNEAIYVGAICYDSSPDSILLQLGERDEDINADLFTVSFDTYHQFNDAYGFQVSSSGVQADWREKDFTYNAVWESEVSINNSGWIVEMRIPFSAIRFPVSEEQEWGVNFFRHLRRFRENTEWSPAIQGVDNPLLYYGVLMGIKGIKPPVRLNFFPYLSISAEHYPQNSNSSPWSYSYNAGLDMKYGLNQSFTLDLTLLPDFSQVKSDDKIKNLSAFEIIYQEQRSFFTEAVDLFNHNNLFYSRRIGATPRFYSYMESLVDSSKVLEENPSQVQLLNAFKISGRNSSGLALGVFNAITNEMYSIFKKSDGGIEKVLTEPFTNYNVLVADKTLGKGKSIYLMQTSVLRNGKYRDAVALGSGLNLLDKKSNYGFKSSLNYTRRGKEENEYYSEPEKEGINGTISIGKFSGKWKYWAVYSRISQNYDANDLGITLETNQNTKQFYVKHSIFNPVWKFLDFFQSLTLTSVSQNFTGKNYNSKASYTYNATNKKHLSLWATIEVSPFDRFNYYEPRISGMYFKIPGYFSVYQGFSSDYRHAFALDGSITYYADFLDERTISFWIQPIYRVNNHLKLNYSFEIARTGNEIGFATIDEGNSIFGKREVVNIENSFNTYYVFRNNLTLGIEARHYWAGGIYSNYFLLQTDGSLQDLSYDFNEDFIFNTFNVDLTFGWEFSPGSKLSVVYKNYIVRDEGLYSPSYLDTFEDIFYFTQQNVFSLKLMYYIDYFTTNQRVKRKFHSKVN